MRRTKTCETSDTGELQIFTEFVQQEYPKTVKDSDLTLDSKGIYKLN